MAMGTSTRIAVVAAAMIIAASCGGSDDSEGGDSSDLTSGAASDLLEPPQRSVTQVVVTGANAESLELIRSALGDYGLLGESLEEIVIVGSSACGDFAEDLLRCASEAESLAASSGRLALVVLDGDLQSAAEAAIMLHSRPAVFVAGDPTDGPALATLAEVSSTITFVPGGLSGLFSDPVPAFLIGVRDELGAFTPLKSADNADMSSAHHFLDTRLETMIDTREAEDNAVVPEPDVRWVVDLPDPIGQLGLHERAVVVDNTVAFLGNDGVARGLDTETGTELWTKEINTNPRLFNESFVAVAGDTLLLGNGIQSIGAGAPEQPAQSLWALDIRSGAEIWTASVPANGLLGHPTTDGERVYVWMADEVSDPSLRALDLRDGTELWRVESEMSAGPPRVADGEIWTGNQDGVLLGLDAATGRQLVRFEEVGLGTFGIAARPAVTDDRVFFGNDSGTFTSINRANGEKIWSFAAESPNLPSSPVITDDAVIFGSFDGGVYALDTNTGDLRWRHDAGGNSGFLSSAVVADGVVYIAEFFQPASILAIDVITGQRIWELPIGDGIPASPYIDGDTLYIQTPGQFWAIAL